MIVFRLSSASHASSLDGGGARIYGGRWNNPGTAVIYTSSSKALCNAEILANHIHTVVPVGTKIVEIKFNGRKVKRIPKSELPVDWNNPTHPSSTRNIGDSFVAEGKYIAMRVPSAAVEGEFNYILNPLHPDFHSVIIKSIKDFNFDPRLVTFISP